MGKNPTGAELHGEDLIEGFSDNDAVSMRPASADYDREHAATGLPSYDEVTASSSASTAAANSREPLLSRSTADRYAPVSEVPRGAWRQVYGGKPDRRQETSVRMDERLSDPNEMYTYIYDYLSLIPPDPVIRIRGSHRTTTHRDGKKETKTETDFNVVFSLQDTLPCSSDDGWWQPRIASSAEKVYRGSWLKRRANQYQQNMEAFTRSGPGLFEWCQDYCDSPASLKIFRVERTISGFDSELVRREITRIVRATHYQGDLEVTCEIKDRNVDIYSPHRINRWRIGPVRYLFYVSMLWTITWPLLFFSTARWTVYKVDWAFSRQTAEPNGPTKRWAKISEEKWLHDHHRLIQSLVLDRFKGDASDFPLEVDPTNRHDFGTQLRLSSSNRGPAESNTSALHGIAMAWHSLTGGSTYAAWGAHEA